MQHYLFIYRCAGDEEIDYFEGKDWCEALALFVKKSSISIYNVLSPILNRNALVSEEAIKIVEYLLDINIVYFGLVHTCFVNKLKTYNVSED